MEENFYQKTWFIWLMILVFLPVGLFLLWRYGKYPQTTKGIITGVIIVLFFYTVMEEKEEVKKIQEEPQIAVAVQQEPQKNDNKEEMQVEPAIKKVVQSVAGANLEKVEVFDHNDGFYHVNVLVKGKDNLTNNMTRQGVMMDNTRIFKAIYTSNLPIKSANIITFMDFVDKYGNTKKTKAVQLELSKETAAKINWDNTEAFMLDFDKIADGSFIHPALKEK